MAEMGKLFTKCTGGDKVMSNRDYSQDGDPYGITEEYTSQSAAMNILPNESGSRNSGVVDVRGNSATGSRSIPTQAEADAIMRQL